MAKGNWQFWVDRGGTFTDVVARDPHAALHRTKLLSENPEAYDDAVLAALRRLTGAGEGPLPPGELRLGTTVATNALLTRQGEPVLLAITRGFEDALTIGTQERPDIFARAIGLPDPLHAACAAIDERIDAQGKIVRALDEDAAQQSLQHFYDSGFRALAIVLMHGYRYPQHEAALARIAQAIGFTQISVSHQVAPLIRLIARGSTSVVDAALSPVLRRYVDGLESGLGDAVTALYMQSNGGLTSGAAFSGKDAVLSGPAGGIVGMAAAARAAGYGEAIGFDMGGTSTDVSHWAGAFERASETRVAGVRLRAPMLRIETVAAGGGSVCRFDGARFVVGPESAGALPGPACYRRGGPLTVTDCNLLLGKLQADHFPQVFGPGGDEPLSLAASQAAMDSVLEQVKWATGQAMSREAAAEGFVEIAVTAMASAIKAVSLRQGHDVSRAVLVTFGGAGGQLACKVADALGMREVLCHPLASVLSAYGMGLAARSAMREATLGLPLDEAHGEAIAAAGRALAEEARESLAAQGLDAAMIEAQAWLAVRPEGSDNAIEVPLGDVATMAADFAARWRNRFGFAAEGRLIAETLRVEALSESAERADAPAALPPRSGAPDRLAAFHAGPACLQAPLYRRESLAAGFAAAGPLLVVDEVSTVAVEPGWSMRVDATGNLILARSEAPGQAAAQTALDPVRLEVMGALFMAIAEQMGAALQTSASSVNIRERLDFSCAVFDGQGQLIANAPHMPVHLGSMGQSVRSVIAACAMRPGDAFVLNAPYSGGTHLPDITVVMPVYVAGDEAAPAWFVAARGHHADIGGISPGSMPPDSRTIAEEGVLIEPMLLVDKGRFCEAEMHAVLAAGEWPARDPDRNIADLKAQVAACARGAGELVRLAAEQGRAVVDAYMGHVQDHAEMAVRALIERLEDGDFAVMMDNGARIAVAVRIDRARRGATFDFAGTSGQLPDNFNAPLPVVRAAVLYAVRILLDDALPLNEGCLRPLTILVPPGSMLDPRPPAAVVAGNVETSQAIVDALLGALGAMAASQGTMNNFTFGDGAHQYYETIAGGSGAGPGFAGADVVQTHMTNSRLTDPEVLEANFPVLLEEFAIRRGSGGAGAFPGGDGAVRRLRFLAPMAAGILSNRRAHAPFGLAGGCDGLAGRNRIERADGTVEHLPATASAAMQPGDVFVIETPGGGGYGAPD